MDATVQLNFWNSWRTNLQGRSEGNYEDKDRDGDEDEEEDGDGDKD